MSRDREPSTVYDAYVYNQYAMSGTKQQISEYLKVSEQYVKSCNSGYSKKLRTQKLGEYVDWEPVYADKKPLYVELLERMPWASARSVSYLTSALMSRGVEDYDGMSRIPTDEIARMRLIGPQVTKLVRKLRGENEMTGGAAVRIGLEKPRYSIVHEVDPRGADGVPVVLVDANADPEDREWVQESDCELVIWKTCPLCKSEIEFDYEYGAVCVARFDCRCGLSYYTCGETMDEALRRADNGWNLPRR